MKDRLHKIIEDFYDLAEKDMENALASILKMANAQPEEFLTTIKDIEADDVAIIYEALANDLGQWSSFFLNELKRLINEAKKIENPNKILAQLDDFIFIEPEKFKLTREFILELKKELKNEHPTFRYYAISLITDFMDEGDIQTIKLLENHLFDPDWRIRYWTFVLLRKFKKSKRYRLSLTDKIRSKILDTYKFN